MWTWILKSCLPNDIHSDFTENTSCRWRQQQKPCTVTLLSDQMYNRTLHTSIGYVDDTDVLLWIWISSTSVVHVCRQSDITYSWTAWKSYSRSHCTRFMHDGWQRMDVYLCFFFFFKYCKNFHQAICIQSKASHSLLTYMASVGSSLWMESSHHQCGGGRLSISQTGWLLRPWTCNMHARMTGNYVCI